MSTVLGAAERGRNRVVVSGERWVPGRGSDFALPNDITAFTLTPSPSPKGRGEPHILIYSLSLSLKARGEPNVLACMPLNRNPRGSAQGHRNLGVA